MKNLTFSNNNTLPALGLGTWKSAEGEVYDAVMTALKVGYRHIDCAFIYDNQKEIGNAFKDAFDQRIIKREDLWVTSKLWNSSHKKQIAKDELTKTLEQLGLDYLDLYLIHWPVAQKPGVVYPRSAEDFQTLQDVPLGETWQAMEDSVHAGLVKHIGVSNFNIARLKELIADSSIRPEMNQVELHPFLKQQKLVDFCFSQDILMTAYSPLGSNDRPERIKKESDPILMEHPVIKAIAESHNISAAQVLIAWSIHRNIAVIPKSTNPDRIKQNFEASELTLTTAEFKQINDLDENFRYIDGSIWTIEGSPYEMSDLWEY